MAQRNIANQSITGESTEEKTDSKFTANIGFTLGGVKLDIKNLQEIKIPRTKITQITVIALTSLIIIIVAFITIASLYNTNLNNIESLMTKYPKLPDGIKGMVRIVNPSSTSDAGVWVYRTAARDEQDYVGSINPNEFYLTYNDKDIYDNNDNVAILYPASGSKGYINKQYTIWEKYSNNAHVYSFIRGVIEIKKTCIIYKHDYDDKDPRNPPAQTGTKLRVVGYNRNRWAVIYDWSPENNDYKYPIIAYVNRDDCNFISQ
ncbi:hypothetical protein AGMMS49992_29580 [Clostridia bacterium]|nr:hypothetical protein AGMMS49992_29580 [Clostridia bacterium]